MLAWLKALMKLPHCGSAGHSIPSGMDPDGWSAVVNRLMNGMMVNAMRTTSRPRPNHSSLRWTLTTRTPRTRRRMGRIVTRTRSISTMARAEAVPYVTADEGEDVDLEARHERGEPRPAVGRDVDHVERGQGQRSPSP